MSSNTNLEDLLVAFRERDKDDSMNEEEDVGASAAAAGSAAAGSAATGSAAADSAAAAAAAAAGSAAAMKLDAALCRLCNKRFCLPKAARRHERVACPMRFIAADTDADADAAAGSPAAMEVDDDDDGVDATLCVMCNKRFSCASAARKHERQACPKRVGAADSDSDSDADSDSDPYVDADADAAAEESARAAAAVQPACRYCHKVFLKRNRVVRHESLHCPNRPEAAAAAAASSQDNQDEDEDEDEVGIEPQDNDNDNAGGAAAAAADESDDPPQEQSKSVRCVMCKKQFVNWRVARKHEKGACPLRHNKKTATVVLGNRCKMCNKKFSSPKAVRAHEIKHCPQRAGAPPAVAEAAVDSGPVECRFCHKMFETRRILWAHQNTVCYMHRANIVESRLRPRAEVPASAAAVSEAPKRASLKRPAPLASPRDVPAVKRPAQQQAQAQAQVQNQNQEQVPAGVVMHQLQFVVDSGTTVTVRGTSINVQISL
jgi:hypothetical protein